MIAARRTAVIACLAPLAEAEEAEDVTTVDWQSEYRLAIAIHELLETDSTRDELGASQQGLADLDKEQVAGEKVDRSQSIPLTFSLYSLGLAIWYRLRWKPSVQR